MSWWMRLMMFFAAVIDFVIGAALQMSGNQAAWMA